MANKKGDKYECAECGLIISVEDPCGCEPCEVICCGEPMKPAEAPKAETKSKPQTKPKTSK